MLLQVVLVLSFCRLLEQFWFFVGQFGCVVWVEVVVFVYLLCVFIVQWCVVGCVIVVFVIVQDVVDCYVVDLFVVEFDWSVVWCWWIVVGFVVEVYVDY